MPYKVLIVDDNANDRNGLQKHIPWESLNCITFVAENGQEGIDIALTLTPDIIITDISMPGINGIEMTKQIREKLDNVHFIYISCFDDFEFAASGIVHGVAAYILKPIVIDELVKSVKMVISRIETQRQQHQILHELKAQVEDSRELWAKQFFNTLLFGSPMFAQQMSKQMEFLKLNDKANYRMVLFRMDASFVESEALELYAFSSLLNILLKDNLLSICEGYCLNHDSSLVALILNECSIRLNELIRVLYKVQELFFEATQNNVTICISSSACPLDALRGEFKSLLHIIHYEHFVKSGSIIFSDEIRTEEYALHPAITNEFFTEIVSLFYSDDDTEIDHFIDKYYGDGKKISEICAKALGFQIVNSVSLLLAEQNGTFSDVFGEEISVWEKLVSYKTNFDIRQWLKNVLTATKKYLSNNETDKYAAIVSNIKKNIDTNFATFQTLEQIVQNLYISANYANRLFHKSTGQTMFSYLLDRRMNEAKVLLKDNTLKISDVAKMVGYQSDTYFTTVFKKQFGLTPTEYRNKLTYQE